MYIYNYIYISNFFGNCALKQLLYRVFTDEKASSLPVAVTQQSGVEVDLNPARSASKTHIHILV